MNHRVTEACHICVAFGLYHLAIMLLVVALVVVLKFVAGRFYFFIVVY